MDDAGKGVWAIEARAFRVWLTPFTHNFWLLRDAAGAVADQLHGLAVDQRTGARKAIGGAADRLTVVRDREIAWALQPGQPAATAASGPAAELAARWQAAVAAGGAINALGLPYPALWQHFSRVNCNSVFRTLGLAMGFAAPERLLATWAPGIGRPVSQAIVAQYGYRTPPTG